MKSLQGSISPCTGVHSSWYTWKPLTHKSKVISKAPPVAAITVCRDSTCFAPHVPERWIRKSDAFHFSQNFFWFISLRIYFLQKFKWTPNWSILWKFWTTKIWSHTVFAPFFAITTHQLHMLAGIIQDKQCFEIKWIKTALLLQKFKNPVVP